MNQLKNKIYKKLVISYYNHKKNFILIISSVLTLPLVILIRLASPFKKITIESVNFGRIGAMQKQDWFLSEKRKHLHDKTVNLFCQEVFHYIDPKICNEFWVKIWKRNIILIPLFPFGLSMYFWHQKLPGKKLNEIPNFHLCLDPEPEEVNNGLCKEKKEKLSIILEAKDPNLSLKQEELLKGYKLLEKINVPKDSNFVCIQNRDNIYLNTQDKKYMEVVNWDWSYHSYRDSNINNYVLSAENLASKGTFAIFTGLGKITPKKKLPKKIIEYKHTEISSDFMDIFLASQCKFYVCSNSGIASVPQIFRKPIVYVNFPSIRIIYLHNLNAITILKKFYSKSEKRLLNFKEVIKMENEVDNFGAEKFRKKFSDIDILENTPEEIDDVVQEMQKRLDGAWNEKSEDKELQNKFWEINKMGKVKSKNIFIGTNFLRKYKDLLV